MINELINISNSEDFYQNCDLITESYSFNTKEKVFELIVSVNQISYDHPVEYQEWKITCKETMKINGFDLDLMMPYVKMKIMDKHPLLWLYHEDKLYYELKGTPKNIYELGFDLINMFETETGNWIPFHKALWNFKQRLEAEKTTISIPAPLQKSLEIILNKQELSFKLTGQYSGEKKGYADKPETKILMFGNSDVSPYEYSLGQPYIIAEDFKAERIK
ncbi:hypothetical protein Q763_12055 [Flavobacterium beibuense F44-8]|uniref:Uncharacterized protein n=1 Tax=Flavobacterium beibuense F44-8 TaxID=1406840 RepID=A0A0A2LKX5_9FLAO|nr:hypothetical protein [Flavobacterium beibuense]KGO79931.1 hypothetical protein Q763_12055 [Flavobacterium beibuense F44-8]